MMPRGLDTQTAREAAGAPPVWPAWSTEFTSTRCRHQQNPKTPGNYIYAKTLQVVRSDRHWVHDFRKLGTHSSLHSGTKLAAESAADSV